MKCFQARERILELDTTLRDLIGDEVLKEHLYFCKQCQSDYEAICFVQACISKDLFHAISEELWHEFISRLQSRFKWN